CNSASLMVRFISSSLAQPPCESPIVRKIGGCCSAWEASTTVRCSRTSFNSARNVPRRFAAAAELLEEFGADSLCFEERDDASRFVRQPQLCASAVCWFWLWQQAA